MTVIEKITTVDGNTVLVLAPEIVAELGVRDGDEVALTMHDRTLTVQPIEEKERAQLIKKLSRELIEKRRSLYEALARGAE